MVRRFLAISSCIVGLTTQAPAAIPKPDLKFVSELVNLNLEKRGHPESGKQGRPFKPSYLWWLRATVVIPSIKQDD